MLAIVVLVAGGLGIVAWSGRRWLRPQRLAARPSASAPAAAPRRASGSPPLDPVRVQSVGHEASQRLWVLAFSAPSQAQNSDVVNRRVRANIVAALQVDTLDPKHFPRRPALLPQLMQAMNEPRAASDKISRIIAHDPVLAADVLRLANSSLYRISSVPIETIQRATVVCGVDALRGMVASAMLRPVFRATRSNFPRLPRMLWERTERATRAAELFALAVDPTDRFEAQLVVLLAALGPLVVYGAALDVYARNPHFSPNGDLCVELIGELAPRLSQHIARSWEASPRLIAALETSPDEPLNTARQVGELFGTLSFLESQTVISSAERVAMLAAAGVPLELADSVWAGLRGPG